MRVFVSSTSDDLQAEREALRQTIAQFDALFVGMEYFGSDPRKPAAYCIEQVQQSDLYIAVIGDRYGSIDTQTGKSFTELEYLAARSKGLDCLIYFKNSPLDDPERLSEFKSRLRLDHVVATFSDIAKLTVLFTTDFVKLLHGPHFYKLRISHPQAIPTEPLRLFCKGALREQINIVAHQKYNPDLYVSRNGELRVQQFTHFSQSFTRTVADILAKLKLVRTRHLGDRISSEDLQALATKLLGATSSAEAEPTLAALEQAFLFEESKDALKSFDDVFRASEAALLKPRLAAAEAALRRAGVGKAAAGRAATLLDEAWRRVRIRQRQPEPYLMNDILRLLPSIYEDAEVVLASNLLQDLRQQVNAMSRRCLAIVDQAGRGKTNVVCHLAASLSKQYPVFLISGQAIGVTEGGVEKQIQSILDRQFTSIFPDWLRRASLGLEASQSWLFIIIDGINEASEPAVLSHQLGEFMARIEHSRIKVILTCRDIFWEMFRHRLRPFQFFSQPLTLDDFTNTERDEAVGLYLKAYDIRAELSPRACETLKHPLLLRLFCEAHRDSDLGFVDSIQSLSVFDHFMDLVSQEIAQRLNLIDITIVRDRLISIARLIWERRDFAVPLTVVGVSEDEAHRAGSLHNCLRDHAVIAQVDDRVRFVYDEVCEYFLALYWCASTESAQVKEAEQLRIARTAAANLQSFPTSAGALLYFDELQEASGALINVALLQLASSGDEVLVTRQYAVMRLLEAMAAASTDSKLVSLLARYEECVADELKPRLSKVIVEVARIHRNHAAAQALLRKILELEPQVAARKTEAPEPPASVMSDEEQRMLLPPARYHYSVETRLCALSILVSSSIHERHRLAAEATDRLGRVELHSALRAIEAIDYADDSAVLALIPSYLKERAPEYRIFSAQLLRARFGQQPAQFLVKLLHDPSTRVRDYVRELLRGRQIDLPLAEALAHHLENAHPSSDPALLDLLAVLERRGNFAGITSNSPLAHRLVKALSRTLHGGSLIVRMECARALYAWRDSMSSTLLSLLQARLDGDVVMGGLIKKIRRAAETTP